jgi:hypothetical protein
MGRQPLHLPLRGRFESRGRRGTIRRWSRRWCIR